MPVSLQGFQKKKDYLICVDSDGCAMDTMNIKHIKCFGPCMVEEWGLQRWEKEILETTPNPGGGAGDSNETKKSDASEYAKAYSARMNQEAKAADDNAPVNI